MRLRMVIAVCLMGSFFSCRKDAPPDHNLVVIEAYIFAGQPVTHVRLTEMLPYGGADTVADPINDATVSISWRGNTYSLEPDGGDTGFYFYPGTDLQILEGEVYELDVDYYDKTASSMTIVPPPPGGLQLSTDTLYYNPQAWLDSLLSGGSLNPGSLIATWNTEPGVYYYPMFEMVDTNATDIPMSVGNFVNRFLYAKPTTEGSYEMYDFQFTKYGAYKCWVFRINDEYAAMYNSMDQDSRTLNEPLNNVRNGVGVFSAFNGIYKTFSVQP